MEGAASDAVDRLRDDLEAAGYTVDGVQDLLGPVAAAALSREQALPARRALEGRREPAAVLARTFVLGTATTQAELDRALPRLRSAGAESLGLVEAAGHGDAVHPLLDLRPYAAVDAAGPAAWWVVSDLGELATGSPLRPDHVLGVGGASTTLAQATLRRRLDRVLDIGTGCGVQALHASRHAARVTATDVSARALRMAALNLALAGAAAQVELLRGDLLDPVAGREFDLVVSNPPFVITPRRAGLPGYTYRDGGLSGDEVVRRLVCDVGQLLAPGGTAQLLGNWEVRAGESWHDRVGEWVSSSVLDAWVVQREVQDPAQYAETWIRDGGEQPGERFDELYAAWLDDFAARGVEAVGLGLITLRRPADTRRPLWQRLEDRRGPVRQPLGEYLARCLDATDALAAMDDDALLETRWRVAPDVTEERHHRPGQAEPSAILLRQTDGFGRVVQVGSTVAAAVGACDGELSLGRIASAVAALLEVGDGQVRAQLLPAVRDLAADGVLIAVGSG